MPRYRVEVTYNMGMSRGGETITFEADDDKDAEAYLEQNAGGSLSGIKRGLRFRKETLSRVVGS